MSVRMIQSRRGQLRCLAWESTDNGCDFLVDSGYHSDPSKYDVGQWGLLLSLLGYPPSCCRIAGVWTAVWLPPMARCWWLRVVMWSERHPHTGAAKGISHRVQRSNSELGSYRWWLLSGQCISNSNCWSMNRACSHSCVPTLFLEPFEKCCPTSDFVCFAGWKWNRSFSRQHMYNFHEIHLLKDTLLAD